MENPKKKLIDSLAGYATSGVVSEAAVKAACLLPMVEIGKCRPGTNPPWTDYLTERGLDYEEARVFMSHSEFPLLEASYWIEEFGLYVFRLKDKPFEDGSYRVHYEYYLSYNGDGMSAAGQPVTPLVCTGSVLVTPEQSNRYVIEELIIRRPNGKKPLIETNATGDVRKGAVAMITYGLMTVKFFMDFQMELDYYPVEVRRKTPRAMMGTPKLNKKLEVMEVNSPKIIYLNKLPEARTTSSGTGEDPVPTPKRLHQRVGYWKTLTHERYAKHEKFGVEKGVRVRPSWCGKLVSEYNGNVYRVMLNPEDKVEE